MNIFAIWFEIFTHDKNDGVFCHLRNCHVRFYQKKSPLRWIWKLLFFFTGPSGRPKFIRERLSTSSSTLSLVWAPPPQSSLNAEFRGFELTYKPTNYIAATVNTSKVQINVKDSVAIQVIPAGTIFLERVGTRDIKYVVCT